MHEGLARHGPSSSVKCDAPSKAGPWVGSKSTFSGGELAPIRSFVAQDSLPFWSKLLRPFPFIRGLPGRLVDSTRSPRSRAWHCTAAFLR